MNGGSVQRVLAVPNPQKACALFEGLRPQLGHFFQLRSAGNTVFFPVGHDISGQHRADARHMGQQGRRRGGKLYAHAVDAALDHAVQRFFQLAFFQIVLILPHADSLGVDLHQFRQRILHPAGNADRAAQADVILGKLLGGQLTGGIDGSSRLADDHISRLSAQFRQQTGDELLRLPAGGTVADGDRRHTVFPAHGQNFGFGPRLRRFLSRKGEVTHVGGQHFAVFIHDSQLAAGTEARIHAQRHFALDRRGHEQLVQVLSEHLNGGGSGPVGQLGPNLPFQTGLDQPFPRVLTGRLHLPGGRTAFPNEGPFQNTNGGRLVHANCHFQKFLPFAAVNRQNTVAGKIAYLLRKVVIHAVDAVFVLSFFRFQHTSTESQLPQFLACVRVVAELLGQYIPGALQRVLDRFNALVRLNKSLCDLLRRFLFFVLHQKLQGQRFQSLFLGDGSAGAAFGAEGTVKVFQFRQRRGSRQFGG